MVKLAIDFSQDLSLAASFSGITALTRLLAFPGGRAVAFGWGTGREAGGQLALHWFADIRREGVSYRVLPRELTERAAQILGNPGGAYQVAAGIVPFQLGDQVGLLLGSELVYLYPSIDAEPVAIEVENHFRPLAALKHASWKEASQFRPESCGSPDGNRVPVMLTAPQANDGDSRYACLLEIDAGQRRARWLHTGADGGPRSTNGDEYRQFDCGDIPGALLAGGALDRRPLIYDGSWIDKCWYLYLCGFHHFRPRFGAKPSVLTRNQADLSLLDAVFVPQEESYGRICASRDRLILTPLRKGGPRKGKQSVYLFGEKEELPLATPRGYAKHVAEEYCDGVYWMLPEANAQRMPGTLLACRAG